MKRSLIFLLLALGAYLVATRSASASTGPADPAAGAGGGGGQAGEGGPFGADGFQADALEDFVPSALAKLDFGVLNALAANNAKLRKSKGVGIKLAPGLAAPTSSTSSSSTSSSPTYSGGGGGGGSRLGGQIRQF